MHLVFFVVAVFMALANFNHVGLPFGHNPYVSGDGWWVGALFGPFWVLIAIFNMVAFRISRLARWEREYGDSLTA